MTHETYCPECKQNVPKGAICQNCGYVFVDPIEALAEEIATDQLREKEVDESP